jgi:hypothetical protein
MNFDELKQVMSASGSLEVGSGASEAEIQTAEASLGVRVKGDYRKFLLEFGWGGVGYLELYGLGQDVPKHLDLVEITKSERTEMSPRLRLDLLPIMNDGAGNLVCLETTSDGPQVVLWDHEEPEDQEPTVEADDFASWFASAIAAME